MSGSIFICEKVFSADTVSIKLSFAHIPFFLSENPVFQHKSAHRKLSAVIRPKLPGKGSVFFGGHQFFRKGGRKMPAQIKGQQKHHCHKKKLRQK